MPLQDVQDIQITSHASAQAVAAASQAASHPRDDALHASLAALQRTVDWVEHALQFVWADLQHATRASRPLLAAAAAWLQHMTPKSAQLLQDTASAWISTPAVQHALLGTAVLSLALLRAKAARRSAPHRAAAASAARRDGKDSSWHAAGWAAAGAGTGAALLAAHALHDSDDDLTSPPFTRPFDAASSEVLSGHNADVLGAFDVGSGGALDVHSANKFGVNPGCTINPATGLPMVGDSCAGVDVMGNPYGTDLHDTFSTDHGLHSDNDGFGSSHDSFGSSFDSFDCWSSGSSWD